MPSYHKRTKNPSLFSDRIKLFFYDGLVLRGKIFSAPIYSIIITFLDPVIQALPENILSVFL